MDWCRPDCAQTDHASVLLSVSTALNGSFQVLMVEPPLNERAQRQEVAAMMFETFKVQNSRERNRFCFYSGRYDHCCCIGVMPVLYRYVLLGLNGLSWDISKGENIDKTRDDGICIGHTCMIPIGVLCW